VIGKRDGRFIFLYSSWSISYTHTSYTVYTLYRVRGNDSRSIILRSIIYTRPACCGLRGLQYGREIANNKAFVVVIILVAVSFPDKNPTRSRDLGRSLRFWRRRRRRRQQQLYIGRVYLPRPPHDKTNTHIIYNILHTTAHLSRTLPRYIRGCQRKHDFPTRHL